MENDLVAARRLADGHAERVDTLEIANRSLKQELEGQHASVAAAEKEVGHCLLIACTLNDHQLIMKHFTPCLITNSPLPSYARI